VAEKLALEQVLGHRRAILGDEELVAPLRTVMKRRSNELLAGPGLALDEHGHAGLGDLVQLREQGHHRLALPQDRVRRALPLFLAALQERVLLVQPLFCRGKALDEPRARDRQRCVGREHRQDLDVVLVQHRRRVAVVDLKDAEDLVALPQRDPIVLRIDAPMSDSL
jgi:hypothetical protein